MKNHRLKGALVIAANPAAKGSWCWQEHMGQLAKQTPCRSSKGLAAAAQLTTQ
jgi:hypothetical protein